MTIADVRRTTVTATLLMAAAVLAGCGGGLATGVQQTTVAAPAAKITGQVHGGQPPIAGATIQLYAVGITGMKSAATPLISKTILTDATGGFIITGDWDCTSNTAAYGANPLLYLVASGGNPGISSVTNNSAINMMAALGPCRGVNGSTFVSLNELTTVAAAYALAPFMSDVTHVGAQGANAIGLVNAFNNANLLVNTATGAAPGVLPANVTVPVNELNSLADILASCVNTNGAGGACSALFSATTPSGGSAPTDIVGVILNIAANPSLPDTSFFNMMPTSPPFQPVSGVAPKDWTIALRFTGGGLNAPTALALDAAGDVWVANAGGNSVTELGPNGAALTGSTGYTGNGNLLGAQGIAVDRTGNVWVADTLLSSVVELTVNNGVVQSNASFTNGGIDGPMGIAIDSQNNVWIANFAGGSVTELNSAGAPVGSSPLTAGGTLQTPTGIAIDPVGRVWVSDSLASDVVEFSNSQSLLSGGGFTDGAILAPQGVAVDGAGHTWVAYQGTNAASIFSNATNGSLPAPVTGGGLSMPTAVAIDGQGVAWITNRQAAGSLSQLSVGQAASLSPANGLGSLASPAGIAIDASGSIWTANAGDNSVSEFIGIASPVATPLAMNVGP
jgi:sugar lactone lactonase YvrE